MSSAAGPERRNVKRHAAGAFDVRNIIAGLIGVYGIVLIVVGLIQDGPAQMERTGGVNADLWAGLAMVVFALAFLLWARLRPVVVDPGAVVDGEQPAGPPGH